MRSEAKEIARGLIRKLGFEVTRYDAEGWRAGWRPTELAKLAQPKTVIDVGVGPGTPQLYRAFPDAHQLLLEPLVEFEPELRRITSEYRGEYRIVAVGSEAGEAEIRVERGYGLTKSSIQERTSLSDAGREYDSRKVPVQTLDEIIRSSRAEPPFVLKIDTEGYELEVIKGATETLKQTDLVIAEVAVAPRFVGGYTFHDFVGAMYERGFGLYSIISVAPYRDTHRVVYIDGVFARNEVCLAT